MIWYASGVITASTVKARTSRPSPWASCNPRLHLSPNEATSELCRDSQI